MTLVLCTGVSVVDFVFSVAEMPREAIKYRSKDSTIVGGGCAANAAVAVARLGGEAWLAARIGDDVIADMMLNDLKSENVNTSLVQRFSGKRSQFASIFVTPDGERQIVSYRDLTISQDPKWLQDAELPAFDAVLADTRWAKGTAAAMMRARDKNKPGIIDGEAPFAEAMEALPMATHIALSRQGIADLTGIGEFEPALRKAIAMTSAFVCATDGEHGVFWLEDGHLQHMPAFRVTAIDSLGAGDVWHGAFALALGQGQNERAAIRFASAVAAIKCTRFGGRAGSPTLEEVNVFLAEQGPGQRL
jgi:sulfofructose kinase